MPTIAEYVERIKQFDAARITKRADALTTAEEEYTTIARDMRDSVSKDVKEVKALLAQVETKVEMLSNMTTDNKETYVAKKVSDYDGETTTMRDELLITIFTEISKNAITNSESSNSDGVVVVAAGGRK